MSELSARFAWNGLSMKTPRDWEPSVLERGFVRLEADEGAVCEIRFSPVRGSFSFDDAIRRVCKGVKGTRIEDIESSAELRAASQALEASGLRTRLVSWSIGRESGPGAFLYHPGTKMGAAVRFFGPGSAMAAQVLGSLRDHTAGATVPWEIFGMTFRTPSRFVLTTFSFHPGLFKIALTDPKKTPAPGEAPGKIKGCRWELERRVPGRIALKDSTLGDFAKTTWGEQGCEGGDSDRIVWEQVKARSLGKMLGLGTRTRGEVWHSAKGDAILSVVAAGSLQYDFSPFAALVESYGIIQEK